ncbi:hypothetical protein CLV84_4266 [Neolewinella xylanilytica]|uniref:Uncharacterized protein n=1 Tax=Neolewinella xylanilytica TaxID=1514080 RepID=A0A2S6I013_9BACT|nr:hypothetical protein [Neolewinella xylanilytica]PPK84115.1 hypothetical protein CLV84_4266 [Neolewinella xylanilytica]
MYYIIPGPERHTGWSFSFIIPLICWLPVATIPDASPASSVVPATHSPTAVNEHWLEAECAEEGQEWQPDSTDAASGKYFVYFPGNALFPKPKRYGGPSQLTFQIDLSETTEYQLFLRLNAPEIGHNSFWVSIDDGPWKKFWKQADRAQLSTDGFEWREVVDDGNPLDLQLTSGRHTIRVAARESGTQLDKLCLAAAGRLPAGMGESAPSCPRRAETTLTPTRDLLTSQPAFEVFPNPATTELTIRLPRIDGLSALVRIVGADGRTYREHYLPLSVSGSPAETTADIASLPAGSYRLQLMNPGHGAPLSAAFIKL